MTSTDTTVRPAPTTEPATGLTDTGITSRDSGPRSTERATRWRGGLLAAATLVTAAAAISAALTRPDAAPVAPTPADPLSAYRSGGSVYQQQVPQQGTDPWAGYRSGGSVYRQQVPQPADPWDDPTRWYGPGSATYRAQVPQ